MTRETYDQAIARIEPKLNPCPICGANAFVGTENASDGYYNGRCNIFCGNVDGYYCLLTALWDGDFFPENVAIAQWNGLRYEKPQP